MFHKPLFTPDACRSFRIGFILPALLALTTGSVAEDCPQPMYRGMQTGDLMRFLGETGPLIYREHGTIETATPRHIFSFTTTHSNGFPREYLMLEGFPAEHSVDSVVIRKNPDFTNAEGPASFLLTPDLIVKFYYATNQAGQEAMHAIRLDDTWKLESCGAPYKAR